MKAFSRKILVLSFLLLIPSSAFALETEYYTYGGFDAVVSGFQRLALIFSDGGYKGLYFSVIVMALLFGGAAMAARATAGLRFNPVSWLFPIGFGAVIYLGLVVPTGIVHIYDDQTNRYQAVGGIPDGIVAVAGALNLMERGMVEIISTSGDPRSYIDQAGGTGFLGLFQAASMILTTDDTLIDTSVNKYIKDCVSFELTRPGTNLTVDELRRTTTDFKASLSKADSPAIYTVYYDLTVPGGQTMTCQESWTKINAYLSAPAHLEENLKGICSQLGYDITAAASYQKCKTSLQATLSDLGVEGATTDDFIRQAYLSKRLHDVYRDGDLTAVMNYKFLSNASGTMTAANEWLPIMKGVLTAMALGLVPFLALFIPTPLLGKALSVMVGFFIWLTAWGVTDAILHQFLMDYGSRALEGLRQHGGGTGFGMDAFYFMPNETLKILGMFGTVRMAGMMLATVMTGLLVKFGGHALAMMGGSLMGQVQSAGQQGAGATLDPSGRASALKSNAWSMPTETIANQPPYNYRGMMTEGLVNQTWGIEGAAARIQNMQGLQNQGTLPESPGRTGLGEFARRSQAMDKIATPEGILGYGTTPNQVVSTDLRGEHSLDTTDSMGWRLTGNTLKDTKGKDVSGTLVHTGAPGVIKTHIDGDRVVVDQIEVAGLTGKFGLGYRDDAVRKGAHSIASEQTWSRMRQKVEEDSKTSSEAKSFRDTLGNNISEEVGRSVEDGSAFKEVSKETQREILDAGASIGLGGVGKTVLSALTLGAVKIDGSVTGKYQLIGDNGKAVEFTASEKEVNALRNTASRLRESALTKTLQTSEGLKYASSLSASDMGKEGHSWIQEAASRETSSTVQDMELMTSFVMFRARKYYGSASMNNLQKTVEDMAAMRTGPPSVQKSLNQEIQEFIADRYRTLGETNGKRVQREMEEAEFRTTSGIRGLRIPVETAAKQATSEVGDNRFDDPRKDLEGPTNDTKKRMENRRAVMEHIVDEDGAFDFGPDPLEQLGRRLSKPMKPGLDAPSARNLPGGPGFEIREPATRSPEWLNTHPSEGISTIGGKEVRRKSFEVDPEVQKRLDEMFRKLDGKE